MHAKRMKTQATRTETNRKKKAKKKGQELESHRELKEEEEEEEQFVTLRTGTSGGNFKSKDEEIISRET